VSVEDFTAAQSRKMVEGRLLITRKFNYYSSLLHKLSVLPERGAFTTYTNEHMQCLVSTDWLDNPETTGEQVAYRLLHDLHHVIRRHTFDLEDNGEDTHGLNCTRLGACMAVDTHLTSTGWDSGGALLPEMLGWMKHQTSGEYSHLIREWAIAHKAELEASEELRRVMEELAKQMAKCAPKSKEMEDKLEKAFMYHPRTRRKPKEVREAVRQTAHAARGKTQIHAGDDSDFWNEVQLKLAPVPHRVPWEEVVREFLALAVSSAASGTTDYSYALPPRISHAYGGVINPRLCGQDPVINVILDTSGSMGETDYQIAAQTVLDMMSGLGIQQYRLIEVDTGVRAIRTYSTHEFPDIVHGGGGSDLTDALKLVDQIDMRSNLNVILTDGGIGANHRPTTPCVVVCTVGSEETREKSLQNMCHQVRELGPVVFPSRSVIGVASLAYDDEDDEDGDDEVSAPPAVGDA
jgi:hypothetical protein